MSLSFWIAKKYLKGRKTNKLLSGITLISMAGIAVGVMTLTTVLAVMQGFENDLKDKVLGVNAHILIQNRFGYDIPDPEPLEEKALSVRGVEAAAPFIYGEGLVMYRGRNYSAGIRGVDPEREETVTKFGGFIKEGVLKKGGIALGTEMARLLNVSPGDTVRLLSPDGKVTPMGIFPRVRDYEVTALFESGMYEYDTSLVYMVYEDARSFLSRQGASGISLRIANIDKAESIAREVSSLLPEEYTARDWFRMNRNLYSAMELEKKTMFIILTLIILVASFNIVATLITLVREKTREIGILKSLGFTAAEVKRIFLYNGLIIGGAGITLGELLGLLLCFIIRISHINALPAEVYYSTELKVSFSFWNFFFVGAVAFFITYLAAVFPARQAAKMDVIEAIKYE
jgi:lipoprotein-releasing system permease protein